MGCMNGANGQNSQLDTRIEIVTPENITFQYRVAGPFRRLPAFLIDTVIRIVVGAVTLIVASLVFGTAGIVGLGMGLTLAFWFLLSWFYGGLFETLWKGQTPGKWMMGIRVVSIEGQPITPLQAILRNVLREVDAQPMWMFLPMELLPVCFYQVGFLTAILNDRFQRLGDLAAGTMVVVEQRRQLRGVAPMAEPEALRIAAQITPTFLPSRSLARALAAYVQRRRVFSRGRRLEIARHVGDPLRQKFQLPADTDLDMLLCGLYRRAFIADRTEPIAERGVSPFAAPALPPAPITPAIVVDDRLETTKTE